MSSPTQQPAHAPQAPALFKVLPDSTVLYKTWQDAEAARLQQKASTKDGAEIKKLSQVKSGERYQAQDGTVQTYTIDKLIEFQVTGLIVVIVVLAGLSLICAAVGRLIRSLQERSSPQITAVAPTLAVSEPLPAATIHLGLSDQELVVLLTAAASQMLGRPVRVERFRPLISRDFNWTAQSRSQLQSHQLK